MWKSGRCACAWWTVKSSGLSDWSKGVDNSLNTAQRQVLGSLPNQKSELRGLVAYVFLGDHVVEALCGRQYTSK